MMAADDGMKYGTQQTSGIIYCGGLQIRPKNEKFYEKKSITIFSLYSFRKKLFN